MDHSDELAGIKKESEENLDKLKNISQYLTHLESELSIFWAVTPVLLCIADKKGYFIKLNPRWTQLLGYTTEELKGRPYKEFVHTDDLTATSAIEKSLAETRAISNFINRYRHKDGHYISLNWSVAVDPISDLIYGVALPILEGDCPNANQ